MAMRNGKSHLVNPPTQKMLTDYPLGEWLQGSDKCSSCHVNCGLLIVRYGPEGYPGHARVRIDHTDSCEFAIDPDTGEPFPFDDDFKLAGWDFGHYVSTINGLDFPVMSRRAEVTPCLNCWKLIGHFGLDLYLDKPAKGMLRFCWTCAEEVGILKLMFPGKER